MEGNFIDRKLSDLSPAIIVLSGSVGIDRLRTKAMVFVVLFLASER